MTGKKAGRTIFLCQSCGYQAPKWMGKCPDCAKWNSFVEERLHLGPALSSKESLSASPSRPVPMDTVEIGQVRRLSTGIQEFDRVLGGGLVPGSLILIGGDPGIGKSTLMLQVSHKLASHKHKLLYISGEESVQQIKLRSDRLGIRSDGLWVVSETGLESIREMASEMVPDIMWSIPFKPSLPLS